MSRTLYVGKNNGIRDILETSTDGGKTYDPIDVDAATGLLLIIGDDPDTPDISRDAKGDDSAEFTLSSDGTAAWTPGSGVVQTADIGSPAVRWEVANAAFPQGLIVPADDVAIKA